MFKGSVKWFNLEKGYGFISTNEPEGDFFFHYSALQMDGFKKIDVAATVQSRFHLSTSRNLSLTFETANATQALPYFASNSARVPPRLRFHR